jgi:hypothetical protein
MNTKRTNQLLCLLMLVFGLSICSLDAYGKDSSPVMNQESPVYHSPNTNAEKRRLEAGDSESANRGVRVRGVRVRGVRVRGVRVRGGQDGQDGGHFSSGLTDDLSNMLDMESVTNPNNATEEIHFPERLSPIASEQTGFTSHEQPDLYWYISAPFHGLY